MDCPCFTYMESGVMPWKLDALVSSRGIERPLVKLSDDPLRWRCGGGSRSDGVFFNKHGRGSCRLDLEEILCPSWCRGGGGGKGSLFGWRWCGLRCFRVAPCAQHTATTIDVIFSRTSGPSSTSIAEACSLIHRRSSTPLGFQVVRPRNPRCGRWLDLFVGREPMSIPLSDPSEDAWRSVRSGGTLVLDCCVFSS
jgi:hypothetical protein